MIGAIVGDIIGSPYEFNNIHTKDFPLFSHASRATDDTILTIALADCIMNQKDWIDTLHEYHERYSNCGFGGMFNNWCNEKQRKPYYSCGNGSAMRVSPISWLYDSYDIVDVARKSAKVTHDHIEGIKGAEAIAVAISLAIKGWYKLDIFELIQDMYYPNIPKLNEIRSIYDNYMKNDRYLLYTCQGSVPMALRCFLSGKNFEDVIRIAVSIGGDSDTIACMAGSIAEAYHGIPKFIENKALEHLDDHLLSIVHQFKKEIS